VVVHGHFWTGGSILQWFGFKLLVVKYFSSALVQCYSSVGVIFQVLWLIDYITPRWWYRCHFGAQDQAEWGL